MNRYGKFAAARKALAITLALCLILSSFGVAFAADELNDVNGHWAEKQLKAWIDKGYIQGYADGTVKPDNSITRAEFMTIVNRSFGFKDKAEVKAIDVDPKNWDYEQVAIALKAGYISGYEDGSMKPGDNVTRQEIAVMLASLLKLDTGKAGDLSKFKDASKLPEWSKNAVGAVVGKGIFDGYEDGTLGYEKNITRAEAIVTLDRAMGGGYAATYDKAGTYGPATGNQTLEGNVLVNAGGITLQNVTVTGNLTIGEGVGEGDVNLINSVVKGETFVNGGGANSIHFNDSVLFKIVVDKKTGEVRIVAEGKTTVKQVDVQSNAKIDNSNATNGGFNNVSLTDKLPSGSKVSMLGNFDNVDVNAKGVSIDVPNGSIKKLSTTDKAGDTQLNLGKDAKITDLILKSVLKVTGEGKIEKATINKGAEGTKFEKQPDSTVNSDGTTTGGGGTSSNDDPPVASIKGITATNGSIVVEMTAVPPVGISIGNFTVTKQINDGAAASVTPTALTEDRANRKVTLTVPAINQTAVEQVVKYSVTYKNKTETGTFTISASAGNNAPVALTVTTQSLTVGGMPVALTGSQLAADADGDSLVVNSATASPTGVVVSPSVLSGVLYLYPVAVGNATVTAIVYDGKGGSVDVTFGVIVSGGSSSPTVTGLVYSSSVSVTGATYQLSLSATLIDMTTVDVTAFATGWSSSNTSIATVSSTGLLTPLQTGSTVVTATYGGFTAAYNVSVVLPSGSLSVIAALSSPNNSVTLNVYGLNWDSGNNRIEIENDDSNAYLVVKFSDNIVSDLSGVTVSGIPRSGNRWLSVHEQVYLVIGHDTLTNGTSYPISITGLRKTVSGVTYSVDTVTFDVYKKP
ncbi:S-layer homology domain-containing protein [Paenibacillus sp. HJGM_3]|uniref:S-layer homology domain-containing protein n=1 Tax=Paenibacillus sp. HJGM_3 TaxID=3379816 RepID=UPI00385E9362